MRTPPLFPAVLALLTALPLAAQETAEPLTPRFSGTTTLRAGFQNLGEDLAVPAVPGFSSELGSTSLTLTVDGKSTLPALQRLRTSDGDSVKTGTGWEAGIQTDLGKLFTFSPGSSKYSTDATSSSYSLVQPMIDWYENHKARFGLPDNPFGSAGWPTTSYGGSTGRYAFLRGAVAEPAADVAWSSQRRDDALQLYTDIKDRIGTVLDALASDVVASGPVDQYVYAGLSPEARNKALKKQQALNSFKKVTDGVSSSASLTGPQVTGAWVRAVNLLGALDLRLDFLGASLKAGRLVTSPRAGQPATGALATASLTAVPGLEATVAADVVGGSPQVAENYDTSTLEYDPGDPAWVGLQARAGWTQAFPEVGGEGRAGVSALWPDAAQVPGSVVVGATASWLSTGPLSVDVSLEAHWLKWTDRYAPTQAAVAAGSAGASVTVDWLGLAPHAKVLWKEAGYGGTGGNRTAERLPGTGAQADFDAAGTETAQLWDAGLRFDPRYWLGRETAWLDVGANGFRTLGSGWYASLGFGLRDTLELPVTGELGARRYVNTGRAAWTDASSLPDPGLLEGMTLSAGLRFQPLKAMVLGIQVTDQPSASLRDSQRILQANLTATLTF